MAGLWNTIFLGSNVSLAFILPFAYFYYEAAGKRIIARFYEATVILLLLSVMSAGFVYLVSSTRTCLTM
jgi:hypothetical protein